jgi:hypothetical protein
MQPALIKLIVLTTKGAFRRSFRGARTVRGSLLLAFTVVVIALMVVPSLVSAFLVRGKPGVLPFGDWLEPYLPFMVLLACVLVVFTSAAERAFYFTPAEVDLLFPAPFHRRDLLFYKLAKTILGSLILSLFLAVTSLIYFRSLLAAFVGIWLTLIFIQLIGIGTALLGQIVVERAYTMTRKLILLAIALLLLLGLVEVYSRAHVTSASEVARMFRQTWAGTILLAPFLVFSFTIMAGRWFPDLAMWSSVAAGIDLGLLALVIRLDADYLESAAAVSHKLYEQVRRARQGGGLAMVASGKGKRIGLPLFPWLGGFGPLAWRQLLLAMRTSRQVILTSVILFGFFAVWTFASSHGPPGPAPMSYAAVGMMAYLTFLFSFQLPWAFRGDIDHMDLLKTLPVRPLALASGELAGGIAVLSAMQLLAVICFWAAGMSQFLLLLVVAFAIPLDALLLALNNLFFLIYPVRFVPSGTADFQFMGRAMLFMLLEMLALFPCVGLAAGVGGIAYFVSGLSWIIFGVAAWIVLVLELPLFFWALAWAFERFDPATHTPAQ